MTPNPLRLSRFVLVAVLFMGAASAVPSAAWAQRTTTATLRGRVTGEEGAPLPGAQVEVRNVETGFQRGALTDDAGRFLIPLIPPGSGYTLRASSIGYQTVERAGYEVGVGDVVSVTFELPVQPVEVAGIEVGATAATRIDVTQGGVVQRIGPEQVENLPVNGRDFTDFLNLSPLVSPQPHVTTGGQFSIGGARTSGTNVQIDGADANNIFFGENRGSSRIPFAFSLESIKEFQLITNGLDVEYGSYQGGVVNAVTRSGTNDLRGTGFVFLRDQALTNKDFLAADPRDFRVAQFGLSLSGPIVRDKVHFFVSLDAQDKQQPIEAATPVSARVSADSLNRLFQVLQTRYGLQNANGFFGNFEQGEDDLVLFGRVDWDITARHRLTIRQNYSDFEQTNDRIGRNEAVTNGGPFRDEVSSTVVELNSILGANVFNVFRFQWSDEDRPRPGNEPGGYLPEIRVTLEGFNEIRFGGDGILFRNRLQEQKLQLIDNVTYRAGDHTFKVGTNNVLWKTTNTFWLLGNGSYRFRSLRDFESNRPDTYSRFTRRCPVALTANQAGQPVICSRYDVPFAEFSAIEWSAYAQDDWQVTERLLLTAGVRVSGTSLQDEPGKIRDVESAFRVPTGFAPDFTGISPRLSFTYDLRGRGERVLRGGLGLLVARAPTVLAGNVFQADKPLLSVSCTSSARNVPAFNLQELFNDPLGQNNPAACAGGQAPSGRPEHTVFSQDFDLPQTLKASVGYEHLFGSRTKVGVDFIFSQTKDAFSVRDLNLKDSQFTLASEAGRPVFVLANRYNPRSAASTDRLRSTSFDRIYYNVSEGEARSYNLTLEVDQRAFADLQVSGRYAFSYAYDNSSFSCCTSGEGFSGETTAGDPNFIGDIGDDVKGAWGPSRFERRHTFVVSFLYRGPWGIRANGIWRSQSGTPWTPTVDGDVNGDGVAGNDRAFVGTNLEFRTPADATTMSQLIDEFECLQSQVGAIAKRNGCRNPWWHSLDLRLSKEIETVGSQRVELLVDLFNVLDGVGSLFCDEEQAAADAELNDGACGWGNFLAVFGSNQNLLRAEAYNAAAGRVIYSVNRDFGTELPSGFDPFQFQAQIGLRYRF
ncbi:MAG: TonB-dependent receptor [Gemmatimonadetes bacterium]|nr:TonB-dependent receptor [Gemmatimonadota bacterium]